MTVGGNSVGSNKCSSRRDLICFSDIAPTDEISPATTLVAPNTIAANSHGRRSDCSAVLPLQEHSGLSRCTTWAEFNTMLLAQMLLCMQFSTTNITV